MLLECADVSKNQTEAVYLAIFWWYFDCLDPNIYSGEVN